MLNRLPPEKQQQLIQRFDKNGNGKIDPDEMDAVRQFMQQRRGGVGKGAAGRGGAPGAGARQRRGGGGGA